ncbi:MAG TPA: DnaJ domain-containing protein [Vicinamibacterales bacterium]|nr:DnaJ domain-containing protein [Vicinamibacterales bacterium]
MTKRPFVDYYEVLQLGQNADQETVERVYRLLAKRYHPDNQATGNSQRFAEVSDAYQMLSDPKRRAEYDVRYDENRSLQWKIFDQHSAADGREEDRRIFHGILSLLYVARRRDPIGGGIGTVSLEKLLGVPRQHLEFPIWYLRQRGWVEILDTGVLAITVSGVDKMADKELSLPENRLLPESSVVRAEAQAAARKQAVDEADGARSVDSRPDDEPVPVRNDHGVPPESVDLAGENEDPGAAVSAPLPLRAERVSGFPSEGEGPGADPVDDEVHQARERTREVADRLRSGRL